MPRFAIIGVGGYVAPRHLQAIEDVGGELVAACDLNDSVGILDRFNPECAFFTSPVEFEAYLREHPVDYLSVCTPNHLHAAHVELGFRVGADVICEKPLVETAYGLDRLEDAERAHPGRRVFNVLQLRLIPRLRRLQRQMAARSARADVELTYVTRRGPWYAKSWKGDAAKSGGLGMNIGIHFFDLLQWIFGPMQASEVHLRDEDAWAGAMKLERADVRWFLSTREDDLPISTLEAGKPAFRSLRVDGAELEFSPGFTKLHTQVYADVLEGRGWGLADVQPAVRMVDAVAWAPVVKPTLLHLHSRFGVVDYDEVAG